MEMAGNVKLIPSLRKSLRARAMDRCLPTLETSKNLTVNQEVGGSNPPAPVLQVIDAFSLPRHEPRRNRRGSFRRKHIGSSPTRCCSTPNERVCIQPRLDSLVETTDGASR